jgi:hypothetical protein
LATLLYICVIVIGEIRGWGFILGEFLATPTQHYDGGVKGYLAIALGWLIPGAGHWLLGDRKRGILFFLAIHALFLSGLLLGGVLVLNRPDEQLWNYSQMMAGWPSIVGDKIKADHFPDDADHPSGYAPMIEDAAGAYCGIAGMLNLLVLVDLFLLISGDQEPRPTNIPAGDGK